MKTTAPKSLLENDPTRCVHHTSHGHRCRMPSIEESRYCAAHHRLPNPRDFSLANELAQAAGSLNSPEKVDRALAKVFLAVAEDRIEPPKAYLLGFLGPDRAPRPPANRSPEEDRAGILRRPTET